MGVTLMCIFILAAQPFLFPVNHRISICNNMFLPLFRSKGSFEPVPCGQICPKHQICSAGHLPLEASR